MDDCVDCDKCEELMQPYLDRVLDTRERAEAERHLDACAYCKTRYRFEVTLRQFVRRACTEHMPGDLKGKLSTLRVELF